MAGDTLGVKRAEGGSQQPALVPAEMVLAGAGLGAVSGESLAFIPTPPTPLHPQMWHRLQNVLDNSISWINQKSKYGKQVGGASPPPLPRPQKPRSQLFPDPEIF